MLLLQNIQVAELTRKTAELELKTNNELSLLANFRDRYGGKSMLCRNSWVPHAKPHATLCRNILAELDTLKRDTNHHARRVDQLQVRAHMWAHVDATWSTFPFVLARRMCCRCCTS